jgi:hypothetical protein
VDRHKISHTLIDKIGKEYTSSKKHTYVAKFCLLGLIIEPNSIKLDDLHKIKRESKKNVDSFFSRTGENEGYVKNYYLKHDSFFFMEYNSTTHPSSIGFEVVDQSIEFEMFWLIFFDQNVSLKYCNKYIKQNEGLQSNGFITAPRRGTFEINNPWVIKRSDINKIKRNWNYFNKNKSNALGIINRRLYNSLERISEEDKLIDLMVGFEAMFLGDNSELKYKLSLRVSKFLKEVADPESTFEFIRKCYDLRSKVVHGTTLKTKDLKINGIDLKLYDLINQLRFLLIDCLKLYYQNFGDNDFQTLNRKIDLAIIRSADLKSIKLL